MSYENQTPGIYTQSGKSASEKLASWSASEHYIRDSWKLDYVGFEDKIIGEGAQTWVIDAGPDEVVKLNKPIDAITKYVKAWDHDNLDVDAAVEALVTQRSKLIRERYYQYQPADLLGHIALLPVHDDPRPFEAALWLQSVLEDPADHEVLPLGPMVAIRQPRCKELVNDFLEHATEQQAAELFTHYTNFIERHWWHSVSETTYKFGEQYGVMEAKKKIWDNPLLLLDAGERTVRIDEVYAHVINKRWRNVFNGKDAEPLPRHLEAYYAHMDHTLTEDVFHTVWGQHDKLRFNAPGRTPDSYQRPAGIMRGAFTHPEWQDFCLDALDDIEHPKAIVIEFEKPVAPINDVYRPNVALKNRWVYPGMVAYYRQLPPNPLLDNPTKPVWMWELQFLTPEPLHGILTGELDRARGHWGVTFILRENDYRLNDTYFTGNTGSRLKRSLHTTAPNGSEVFLQTPQENAMHPKLDEHMLAMLQQTAIKNYKIIDGYPFEGHL